MKRAAVFGAHFYFRFLERFPKIEAGGVKAAVFFPIHLSTCPLGLDWIGLEWNGMEWKKSKPFSPLPEVVIAVFEINRPHLDCASFRIPKRAFRADFQAVFAPFPRPLLFSVTSVAVDCFHPSLRSSRMKGCKKVRKNYFARKVILAFDKSYGDNSTSTLSPGTIRMKCFRIFPEMCASTSAPF